MVETTSHPGPWGGLDKSQLKLAQDKFGSGRFAYAKNPYSTRSNRSGRDPTLKPRDRIILDPIEKQAQAKHKGRRKSKDGIWRGSNQLP